MLFKNIAIISSKKDVASLNIMDNLIKAFNFEETGENFENNQVLVLKDKNSFNDLIIKIYTINDDSINAEGIDKGINAELFVFITKHKSKSQIPSLCIHSPGNFGSAQLGGKPKQLCIAPACYLKQGLKNLEILNTIGYDVVQEVTHHGPFLEKPVFFIEIGSTMREWQNKEAGFIIANALMKTLNETGDCESAVGVGGPHTTPNFKKIVLNTNIGLGHVCAKYNLEDFDSEMLEQAFERTVPKPSYIILDWKGLSSHKQRIKSLVDEFSKTHSIKVLKTKDF